MFCNEGTVDGCDPQKWNYDLQSDLHMRLISLQVLKSKDSSVRTRPYSQFRRHKHARYQTLEEKYTAKLGNPLTEYILFLVPKASFRLCARYINILWLIGTKVRHEYTLDLISVERAIVIQLLMCSFSHDWLLAFFFSAARLKNQPRATSGLFEDLALVPHLLISQPSHLLSNYSVFFMLPQKPQCFFFPSSSSFFQPEAYTAC